MRSHCWLLPPISILNQENVHICAHKIIWRKLLSHQGFLHPETLSSWQKQSGTVSVLCNVSIITWSMLCLMHGSNVYHRDMLESQINHNYLGYIRFLKRCHLPFIMLEKACMTNGKSLWQQQASGVGAMPINSFQCETLLDWSRVYKILVGYI